MNERAYLLREEIALLAAIREVNEQWLGTYSNDLKVVAAFRAEEEAAWRAAVNAGISEYDADHPCRAEDARETELRRLCPDLVLREMGAPMLPGFAS